MWFQLLEQDIGRDLAKNIRNEEDRQRGVVVCAILEVQIFLQSQDGRITDIDSAQQTGWSDRVTQ